MKNLTFGCSEFEIKRGAPELECVNCSLKSFSIVDRIYSGIYLYIVCILLDFDIRSKNIFDRICVDNVGEAAKQCALRASGRNMSRL